MLTGFFNLYRKGQVVLQLNPFCTYPRQRALFLKWGLCSVLHSELNVPWLAYGSEIRSRPAIFWAFFSQQMPRGKWSGLVQRRGLTLNIFISQGTAQQLSYQRLSHLCHEFSLLHLSAKLSKQPEVFSFCTKQNARASGILKCSLWDHKPFTPPSTSAQRFP